MKIKHKMGPMRSSSKNFIRSKNITDPTLLISNLSSSLLVCVMYVCMHYVWFRCLSLLN